MSIICKLLKSKGWSVGNVVTFMGTEGHGFNADLLLNGKKVAFVIDSGNGGCYSYQWSDPAAEPKLATDTKGMAEFEADDWGIAHLVDDFEQAWQKKSGRSKG